MYLHNNNSSNLLLLGNGNRGGLGFRFGGGKVVDTHTITPGRCFQVRYPSGGPFFFYIHNKSLVLLYTILAIYMLCV